MSIPVIPPFDETIHIKSQDLDESQIPAIHELRSLISLHDNYSSDWCIDHILKLFLIARGFNVQASRDMLDDALIWRALRRPHLIEHDPEWDIKKKIEGATGKIRRPGKVP